MDGEIHTFYFIARRQVNQVDRVAAASATEVVMVFGAPLVAYTLKDAVEVAGHLTAVYEHQAEHYEVLIVEQWYVMDEDDGSWGIWSVEYDSDGNLTELQQ